MNRSLAVQSCTHRAIISFENNLVENVRGWYSVTTELKIPLVRAQVFQKPQSATFDAGQKGSQIATAVKEQQVLWLQITC